MATRIVLCLTILCVGARLLGGELGRELEAALTANAEALSGIAIEGYQERRLLVDASEGLKELREPGSEKDFIERVPFTLKLQDAMIYFSQRFPKGEYHTGTATNERSFNGSKLFTGVSDPHGNTFNPGMLGIQSPQTWKEADTKRLRDVPVFDIPYLTAAGFSGSIYAKDLGRPIRPLVLSRGEVGALVNVRGMELDGRQLVEVAVRYPDPWASRSRVPVNTNFADVPAPMRETVQFQQELEQLHQQLIGKVRQASFVLDPDMNYAVREMREGRDSEPLMFHTKCDDFVKVDGTNAWLPRKCDIISAAYEMRPNYVAARPVYVTALHVDSITKHDLAEDEFVIWYDEPGTTVADSTHEKASENHAFEYTVPASEADLNRFVWGGPVSLFIVANAIVITVVVGAVIWRSFRRSKSD